MSEPYVVVRERTPGALTEEAALRHLIRWGVFAFLLGTMARTWADPDLWGHLRFGADILTGGLSHTDPYSFTSDIPWTNHEWLAEVLMYLAWAAGGNGGLVVLKMAIVVTVLVIARATVRSERVAPAHRDAALVLIVIGLWARVFVVRPQIFSLLLFAALLWLLVTAERTGVRRLWCLPLIFAAWVNLHGGWLVGIGTVALWTAITLVWRQCTRVPPSVMIPIAVSCLAATLVNPYGWHMWSFLGTTVSFERADINDWQPLFRTGREVVIPWLATAGVAILVLVRAFRSIPVTHVATVLALAAGSFRVNRLDAFFTLSVAMLLLPYVGTAPARAEPGPLWTRRTLSAAAAAVLIAATLLIQAGQTLLCLRLDGPWMPEREAGLFIRANRLEGRLLSWFDWGQYAIWHFTPSLTVSVDGRRETVYSADFLSRHLQLYFEPSAAADFLRELNADYAWLPARLPLVKALEAEGWTRLYAGPISVVLARAASGRLARAGQPGRACFPGP